MYGYTEIESKYTGKIATYSMWEQYFEVKNYAERSEAKKF